MLTLYLQTNKFLRINITFYEIHFKYVNLHKCFIGSVSVESSTQINNFTDLYCGGLAQILSYPPYKNSKIVLSSKYYVDYDILLSYSVIDMNIMESKLGKFLRYSKQMWFVPKSRTIVEMFHLQTEKYQHITLLTSNLINVVVHNGPGTLSKALRSISQSSKKNIYLILTFQCLIFLQKNNSFFWKGIIIFETRNNNYTQIQNVTSETDEQILFPNPLCAGGVVVCILKIKTFNGLFLNISVINFVYHDMRSSASKKYTLPIATKSPEGPVKHICFQTENIRHIQTKSCNFAGLVTYNIINKSFQEISSICSSFKGYKH